MTTANPVKFLKTERKKIDSKIFKAAGIKFTLPNVPEIIHIWQVIKKVIHLYFTFYQTIIVVSFHTISGIHCQMKFAFRVFNLRVNVSCLLRSDSAFFYQ